GVRALHQLHDHRPGHHAQQAARPVRVRQQRRGRLRDLVAVQHRLHTLLRHLYLMRRARPRLVGRSPVAQAREGSRAGGRAGCRRGRGRGRGTAGSAMTDPVAIVGIACRYPDAGTPEQLWENVLAGRRAFRRIPDERMRLDDYWSPDPAAPDKFYARKAAVIDGFEFDRVKYKIAGSTFRGTDMTHWLALDTAARALEDAGFADGEGLPKASTSVIIGNSLTGEFARANLMRLRWPYVRRMLGSALKDMGWDDAGLAN